jgi:hypothetical protein
MPPGSYVACSTPIPTAGDAETGGVNCVRQNRVPSTDFGLVGCRSDCQSRSRHTQEIHKIGHPAQPRNTMRQRVRDAVNRIIC